jgi:DNA-binding transcriptional LysR family regulator
MMSGQHPDIEFVPLVNEPFVLACRRDHELAERNSVTWSELSNYRLIGVGRLSGNRMLLDHALSGLSWRPQWFYEVQHLSTSLGLVEAGLGYRQCQAWQCLPWIINPGQHPFDRTHCEPIIGTRLSTGSIVISSSGKICFNSA